MQVGWQDGVEVRDQDGGQGDNDRVTEAVVVYSGDLGVGVTKKRVLFCLKITVISIL